MRPASHPFLQHGISKNQSARDVQQRIPWQIGGPIALMAPSVGAVPAAGDDLSLFDYDVATLAHVLAGAE